MGALVTGVVTVVALTTAVVANRGEDPEVSAPQGETSASTPSASDLPSTDGGAARAEDVVAAYEEYWTVLLAASSPPNPDHPDLGRVATAPQLESVRRLLRERARVGETLEGRYRHDAMVERLTQRRATLYDCLTADVVLVRDGALAPPQPDNPAPTSTYAVLVRDGDTWRVRELGPGGQAC